MKKIFSAILAIVLLLSLTACGKSEEPAEEAGSYFLYEMAEDGEKITYDDLKFMGMENSVSLEMNTDGTGTLTLFDEEISIKWKDGKIKYKLDSIDYVYESGMITLNIEGSEMIFQKKDEADSELPALTGKDILPSDQSALPAAADGDAGNLTELQQYWDGDWYGWWIVSSCGGDYEENDWENQFWDCCATLAVDADGNGSLVIWDEDLPKDNPLAEIALTISKDSGSGSMGAAITESGYFMDMQLEHADFIIDPSLYDYENFMVIDGWYEDEAGEFFLEVYLRPWGQDWSDVAGENTMNYEDMLPYYYYDWYLPLIEAGEPMPDIISGESAGLT